MWKRSWLAVWGWLFHLLLRGCRTSCFAFLECLKANLLLRAWRRIVQRACTSPPSRAATAAQPSNVTYVDFGLGAPPLATKKTHPLWRVGLVMAVSALVLAPFGWVVVRSKASAPTRLVTTHAKGRTERLSDGSLVSLLAHSQVQIEVTELQNVAILRQGEALITVASNAPRPLMVHVAHAMAAASAGAKLRVAMNVMAEFELLEGEAYLYLSGAGVGAAAIALKPGMRYPVPIAAGSVRLDGRMDAMRIEERGIECDIEITRDLQVVAATVPTSTALPPAVTRRDLGEAQFTPRALRGPDHAVMEGGDKHHAILS
jgi:hypothetical protein